MRDEAASIELLPVDGYYEIESANETLRYMLQLLIMKGKLTSGASHEDTIDARYELSQ